jgi:hypothetical protein
MVDLRSTGRLYDRRSQRDCISDRDHLPFCGVVLEMAVPFALRFAGGLH